MITSKRVEELAREEAHKSLPNLERQNPAHFEGIVNILKNTIIDDYDLNSLRSESNVKELIATDMESLKEALK
ncbi:hypothetical protein [Alkalihalophilus marmarensis]|uniref:hypothetical protein n=1 Tax=Alkalihalophilus marmarensis TaxID=521377 RepID=UPI002DB8B2D2|nr:hypothetical protein [Alkalihalophilus marmarensis]MEC2074237.1 hypothetical protein [Alkalihalophilus marmarensis]